MIRHALRPVLLAAAAMLLAGAPLFAQTSTASVNVTAIVGARATLTLGSNAVTFPDSDPDTVPTITAGGITISAKARTAAGNAVTLTVLATDDLMTGGGDTIGIAAITWTVGGDPGLAAGTMAKAPGPAVSLGSWTGSGNHNGGLQTYHMVNSWTYATGNYATTINYTLTAP